MDESFPELEAELMSLQLRPLSPRLLAQVQQELAPAPVEPTAPRDATMTKLRSWNWPGWRTIGLAAALLVVAAAALTLRRSPEQSGSAPTVSRLVAAGGPPWPRPAAAPPTGILYRPVAASNVLYDLRDEGPVSGGDELPARRVRYRYLDTYTWKNPQDNSSLKWSVPRDEIRVIPASLN